ncbi:MAG TPA: hypothetical protein VFI99_17600 [Nocardioides sp.]|jgi:hypothetical protein|nr:hypothetical protein [Nocardioides sp.]
MFCPKPVDLDTTAATPARATHPISPVPETILLTVNLADGTPRPVFLSDLTTHVSRGVLTATGTVDIPGQGRDAFTAVVRPDNTSDTSVALMLDLGSLHRGLLRLVTDVSYLLDTRPGAGRATNYVAGLLTQILPGAGP